MQMYYCLYMTLDTLRLAIALPCMLCSFTRVIGVTYIAHTRPCLYACHMSDGGVTACIYALPIMVCVREGVQTKSLGAHDWDRSRGFPGG